jgi:hypothetical protein
VSAVLSAAGARYPGAWPGADLEYRPVAGGVEDLVTFQTRPERERVVYDVVFDGVSGLRLVDDVLELLDGTGAPRLRVRAPFVDAADGSRHRARLDLLDCAADRDPRPPWGRPVTPPGADRCGVQVSWGDTLGAPLVYPVVVDPGWVRADTLVTPRNAHVAVPMADGRALIAGGFDALYAANYIADAEVFDPATLTFAVTSPMVHARGRTGGAALATGEVLVASGDDAALATAERWDPATGTWTETSPMAEPRDWVEVAGLPDGRVLVVGGCTVYGATRHQQQRAAGHAGADHHLAAVVPLPTGSRQSGVGAGRQGQDGRGAVQHGVTSRPTLVATGSDVTSRQVQGAAAAHRSTSSPSGSPVPPIQTVSETSS